MDALKHLTNNVPDWLVRLDDLGSQIDKRQTELAATATPDKAAEARSLRNKGSTESLKPKDDGPAIVEPMDTSSVTRIEEANEDGAVITTDPAEQSAAQRPSTPTQTQQQASTAAPSSPSAAAIARQPHDATLNPQAGARQVPRKRQRPASVLSGDGQQPAYRTRSQIIVYYDSYVQSFFDDLVRFVSASRNHLRKAKMAVKVAQIKKLAEMEAPEGDEGSDEDVMSLPSLRYMSSRRYGAMAGYSRGPGGRDQAPDIYDQLDKGLEFVQGTCEHGAHQFLRDADCNDEIKKIQKHLRDVLSKAETEKERVLREEPELAKENTEASKVRTRRPISMRREPSGKEDPAPMNGEPEKLEALEPKLEPKIESKLEADLVPEKPAAPKSGAVDMGDMLQVDNALEVDSDDGDEGVDLSQFSNFQYRSTRHMRV